MKKIEEFMKSTGVNLEESKIPGIYLKQYIDLVKDKAEKHHKDEFQNKYNEISILKTYPTQILYEVMMDAIKAHLK